MNLITLFRKIWPYVRPYRWLVLITLILTLAGSLMAQVNAIVLDRTVDAVNALVSAGSFLWSKAARILTFRMAFFSRSDNDTGKPDATFEEIVQAAKNAYIYDQIMALPKQFASKAQALSGGQQQRIAIARMFLKNPPVIFLDEPTASLDAIATEQIKASIDAIKKDRTVVIISHNISQIIDSDVIYALRNGRVEESGHPDVVYKQGGVYKEIVDASARSMNIGKLARTLDSDGDGRPNV